MAQTTAGYSGVASALEYATDGGTTYNDMAGTGQRVVVGGGARQVGSKWTFDGDTPVLTAGKREHLEITVAMLDENAATGAIIDALTQYEAGSNFRIRWTPAGGATGDYRFTSATTSIITVPPYASADTEDAKPVGVELTIATPSLARAVMS